MVQANVSSDSDSAFALEGETNLKSYGEADLPTVFKGTFFSGQHVGKVTLGKRKLRAASYCAVVAHAFLFVAQMVTAA